MREASFGGGLLDSQQSLFYRDLYDQQLASHLSGRGGLGIADTIQQQIGGADTRAKARRLVTAVPDRAPHKSSDAASNLVGQATATRHPSAASVAQLRVTPTISRPRDFVRELWSAAEQAAQDIGVDPAALLAQAALETGWGKHVMRGDQGQSSHNLFGIKADRRWQGDKVRKTTLEYKDGVALKTRADFRSYDNYEQAFKDYVDFIKGNPRYREALQVTGDPKAYFRSLQKAGYATDPAYADKITRIFEGPQMQAALTALRSRNSRPI